MTTPAIPLLDIARFRSTPSEREAFLADLRHAAHDVGFFYVTGHGVASSVTDGVLDAARAFFALPLEDRLSIDYYYWLHGTLALASYDRARQPRYFQAWGRSLKEALLGLQEQATQGCGSGGWLVPDRWSYAAGPLYTTAMALLALEQKG